MPPFPESQTHAGRKKVGSPEKEQEKPGIVFY